MNNYLAKVKVVVSAEGDTEKKKTEQYLVQDETPTAVEATITKFYEGTTLEWELVSVSKTNIVSVLKEVDGKVVEL